MCPSPVKKTRRYQDVYDKAVGLARMMRHSEVTTAHLLLSMLDIPEVRFLMTRGDMDLPLVHRTLQPIVAGLPTVSGSSRLCIAAGLGKVLDHAEGLVKKINVPAMLQKHGSKAISDENALDLDHILIGIQHRDGAFGSLVPEDLPQLFAHDRKRDADLFKYGIDLNRDANEVFGREDEIDEVARVLARMTRNSPIITGDNGVGKTSLIHGLARRLRQGAVPLSLMGRRVIRLNMPAVIAGTTLRGALEERLDMILRTIMGYDGQMIVFLDDIHTLGMSDAFNMVRGAMSRGDLQCIAATTTMHFVKYREMLGAFQEVALQPPKDRTTMSILHGMQSLLEAHHQVRIHSDAVAASLSLTSRYLTSQCQPSASLDVLDAACAHRKVHQTLPPTRIREIVEVLGDLRRQLEAMERDAGLLLVAPSEMDRAEILRQIEELEREKTRIEWLCSLERNEMEAARKAADTGDTKRVQEALGNLQKLRSAEPLARRDVVVKEDVAAVISTITGIPVSRMGEGDRQRLSKMEETLHLRVKGQDEAIRKICAAVRQSRAGLVDPDKPTGSFMFLGPTGVGKTELAKALAEFVFDGASSLIRIDMSEYMEKHAVSRLIGSPPGYVGFDQGGQLTEAVRQRPYSVVLLDEMEKAHPDVLNLLLQVLDEGHLTDSRGVRVNFRNTIVIMTTNVGAEAAHVADEEESRRMREDALHRAFRPEFLNRLDGILAFHALRHEHMGGILEIQLGRLEKRLQAQGLTLRSSPAALSWLAAQGYDPKFGARPLKRVLQTQVFDVLSQRILEGEFTSGSSIWMDLSEDGTSLTFTMSASG